MMNGMGLMLKSMGIDPEMLANIGKEMGAKLQEFDVKLTAIQSSLARIERHLQIDAQVDAMTSQEVTKFLTQERNAE